MPPCNLYGRSTHTDAHRERGALAVTVMRRGDAQHCPSADRKAERPERQCGVHAALSTGHIPVAGHHGRQG